jgi:hypothetical protein
MTIEAYHATVERSGRVWLVHVSELDRATQARHLRELEAMTEGLIEVMTGAKPSAFKVEPGVFGTPVVLGSRMPRQPSPVFTP